ncbi:MAG TPA: insulinase family protein [Firmicutes bacterium]|jgi:predicted Zn-dependent peptidase|nr:insulinase family protein [Candidatus Fermentithermobacillaceae bacterium]
MSSVELGDRFETVELESGVTYKYLPKYKWKTLSIDVFCRVPMRRETVTEVAMIPRLMRRGTVNHPTLRDLSRHLEGMYGAAMGADANKIGPEQVVRFGIRIPSPGFLGNGSPGGSHGDLEGLNLARAMSFIWEVATSPYLRNGAFPEDRFDTEREEHRRDILSMINDRPRYATVRLIEEISRGSPSGLPSWGMLDDLPELDPRRTWETWTGVLSSSPISIYAIGEGAAELGDILGRVRLRFPKPREAGAAGTGQKILPPEPPASILEVEEFLPGEQTQLCQAFFTGITENHPMLPAALVFDGILGKFAHSKLFVNIREKQSLAYFASSHFNSWRGMILTAAGVADSARHRVRDLVVAQVDAMKRGEISEEELDNTKAGLVRRLRSESDSQSALVRRRLTREIMGGIASPEELVSRILAVGKDDVVAVAEKAELKAVYALRAKDDGANG